MLTNKNTGIRPVSKAPPRPRFLMSPEFDYFMKQKTFTPDLGPQQKPSFTGGVFKTVMRPNPLAEARSSIQTLQLRDELFTKVEEQASRMAVGGPAELDDPSGTGAQDGEIGSRTLLKSMLIVQLGFVIMMLPSVLVRLAKIILNYDNIHLISGVSTISYFGASIVNPIVYGLTRDDFREGFGNIKQGILNYFK